MDRCSASPGPYPVIGPARPQVAAWTTLMALWQPCAVTALPV